MLIVRVRGSVSSRMRSLISSQCICIDSNLYINESAIIDYKRLHENLQECLTREGKYGILMVWKENNDFIRKIIGHDYWSLYDFINLESGVLG